MPVYRPVRTTRTAVPDALAGLRSDVSSLASTTSGQINGTLRRLRAAIAAIPLVSANLYTARGWSVSQTERGVLSVNLPVRAGQSEVAVLVQMAASITTQASGDDPAAANMPLYSLRVGGRAVELLSTDSSRWTSGYTSQVKTASGWSMAQVPTGGASSVRLEVLVRGNVPGVQASASSLRVGVISISTASV